MVTGHQFLVTRFLRICRKILGKESDPSAQCVANVQISGKWCSESDTFTALLANGILAITDCNQPSGCIASHIFVLSGGQVRLRDGHILYSGLETNGDEMPLAFEGATELRSWFVKILKYTHRSLSETVLILGAEGNLGKGSNSHVTQGRVRASGHDVAIKRMSYEDKDRYFVQQELFVSVVINHPNIIRAEDVLLDGEQVCIIMPLISGCTLLHSLNGNPLNEVTVRNIMRQIVDAVVYMHQQGIAHHDLHMNNIMLHVKDDESIRPFIIDLGSCTVSECIEQNNDIVRCAEAVCCMVTGRKYPFPFTEHSVRHEMKLLASEEAIAFVLAGLHLGGKSMTSKQASEHIWLRPSETRTHRHNCCLC